MSEKELLAFVREETEKYQRLAKRSWVLGIASVAFIGGYLFWISSFVRNELFNPDELSMLISARIEEELPAMIKQTENTMVARAPRFASDVSRKIQASIPKIREEMQQKVNDVYHTIALLQHETDETIKVYIQEHADEIVAFSKAHADRSFVDNFTQSLVKEVTTQVDRQMRVQNEEGDGLKEFTVDTLTSLQHLDSELDKLLNTSSTQMSRSDQLKRRLAVSLYQLFSQAMTGRI